MNKTATLLLFCTLLAFTGSAQQVIQRDPSISAMLAEVSPDSLRSHIDKLVSFGTRHTMSTITDSKRGIGAARQWVLSRFNAFAKQSGGRMTATMDTWMLQPDGRRVDQPQEIGNVMATLKGTDPNDDRIFMVSGHIDSRVSNVSNRESDAPGANDDGSGTAAVIELARVMSKYSFPATIIFVTVSGEEQGLLGANHLAERAVNEKWNLEALLNNDIMGSNHSPDTRLIDNTKIRIFSEGLSGFETDKRAAGIRQYGAENDGKARTLARYVKEVGERYVDNLEVRLIYRNDRYLRGGDHTPFVNRDFAAVRITEMNENFNNQHQDLRTEKGVEYGDYAKNMDFEYLRKNTCLNLASLANLAKAPGMPQNVTLEARNLTNSTSLFWQAPKAAGVASNKVKGYYVLMRETHMPFWQKKFFTDKNGLTLPYSKDNYFFAVQAVGEEGHESLPVLPRPSMR